jgi:cobalamin biosynthesis protein CobD/CbiB
MIKIRKETHPNRRQINTALAALLGVGVGKKSIQDISPKTEKKGQLGRRRSPWEEDIKMGIGEKEYECVGWRHLI